MPVYCKRCLREAYNTLSEKKINSLTNDEITKNGGIMECSRAGEAFVCDQEQEHNSEILKNGKACLVDEDSIFIKLS